MCDPKGSPRIGVTNLKIGWGEGFGEGGAAKRRGPPQGNADLSKKKQIGILNLFPTKDKDLNEYLSAACRTTRFCFIFPLFSRPLYKNALQLFVGHILCKGRRTVADVLRCLHLKNIKNFSKFHWILSGAKWNALQGAKILLLRLIQFSKFWRTYERQYVASTIILWSYKFDNGTKNLTSRNRVIVWI